MQTRSTRRNIGPTSFPASAQSHINGMPLLTSDGGTIRAGHVASRLGITPLMVEQLRLTGRVLAVPVEHGFSYPVWQFEGRGMLSGIPTVLNLLRGSGPWSQLAFFLTPHPELDGHRPLDRLRQGDTEAVRRAAVAMVSQGSM